MKRRPQPFTKEELAEMERHAGEGLSTRLCDIAYWLPDDVDEVLIEALQKVDASQGRNTGPLIAALRARNDYLLALLADLLQRYQLKRKRGRQQTPIYDRTDIHRRLDMAKHDVQVNKKTREQAAADWHVPVKVLEAHLSGKRGSERRMAKRRL
jgi:hypothetical protein